MKKYCNHLLFRSLEYSEDATVIFAGDLNLRDKELDSIGGIPAGMEDVWISSGSRKECQYTWDMTRNSNLEVQYHTFSWVY